MAVNKVFLGGLVTLCIGNLLGLIVCNTYGWLTSSSSTVTINYGLWRVCLEVGSSTKCVSIDDPPGSLNATRRTIISAIIHGGISIIIALYVAVKTKMEGSHCSKSILIGTLITGIISGILYVTVSIVYGVSHDKDYPDGLDLGPAFYLNNLAALGVLVGSITVFVCCKNMRPVTPSGTTVMTTTVITTNNYPQQQQLGYYGQQQPPPYPGNGGNTTGFSGYGQQQQPPPPYPAQYNQPAYPPAFPPPNNLYGQDQAGGFYGNKGHNDAAYPPHPPPKY